MNEPTLADDEFAPQIMKVRVTNENKFDINDRFDGVPYKFPQMTPVDIPVDAAYHIFGWYEGIPPEEMRLHVQRRFGWNTPDRIENGSADLFFQNLHILPIKFRLTKIEDDDERVEKDWESMKRSAEQALDAGKPKRTNRTMAAADESAARA